MKKLLPISIILLVIGCQKQDTKLKNLPGKAISNVALATVAGPVKPAHIIYVWFENKGYDNIIGSSSAPYINSLVARGTLFTNTHGLTHPSYPNYIGFFAGTRSGVTKNNCIDGRTKTNTTLYNQLASKGVDFRWYSEGLPSIGSTTCASGNYREKHNPTTIFSQVPSDKNRPFYLLDAALKDVTRYDAMPPVICVTPDMQNDMHDGSVQKGDAWFKTKFSKFIDWSMNNNSIVVVYWDESSSDSPDNRIPVIMIGEHIKANYKVTSEHDHYSFTKLTCQLFGASTSWTSNVINAVVPAGFWQ